MEAITDANKKVEQEMSYDACLFVRNEVQVKGRRRNPVDWNYTGLPDPSTYQINRGYTFHEHYDQLGLINMNGRVYDPVVGRFLSVDPVVGNPLSAQDYNGYSYCANNPLKYTDPSGYIYEQIMENPGCGFGGTGSPTFGEYGSIGGSGFGGDPCHVGDYFYDYTSSTYRTSSGGFGQVSFGEVNSNYVSRYGYSCNVDKVKQFIVNEQYKINSGNLPASLKFNPPEGPIVNTINKLSDLLVYVAANFGQRLPKNAKLTWQIWNNGYGLTHSDNVLDKNADITISIPQSFLSDPSGFLYDCVDHEIVHVNDFASGRAARWYSRYGMDVMEAIMDYRAYSRNQEYSNNYRNGKYDYSSSIGAAKRLLPPGF